MEASSLFVAVAMVIVLAVTSMRFGADSREGFASKERELAARGIVWNDSPATRHRPAEPIALDSRQDRKADDRALANCGA